MSKIKIIDSDHSQIEMNPSNEKELNDLLNNLLKQEARIVIVELPNIGFFTLGIGFPYGFLQYSKDGEPPYLVALADEITVETNPSDEVEFESGGTPTPIPKGLCLPFELVVEILAYCFKNKELPRNVSWVEI